MVVALFFLTRSLKDRYRALDLFSKNFELIQNVRTYKGEGGGRVVASSTYPYRCHHVIFIDYNAR